MSADLDSVSRRECLKAGLGLAAAQPGRGAATRPNILLILADDLGWKDVGYHGSEIRTPTIDRLASEGVRFTQFYSFPLCSPTRAALLTGRSPMRYGLAYSVVRPWSPYGLPLDEHIIPQTLKALGYQTALLGKWHLGHANRRLLPHARGFDLFYGHVNGNIDYFTHEREGAIDWQRNGETVREEGYTTDLLAREAVRFITGRDRSRPLFLYLAFNAPHTPLQAPQEAIAACSHISDPKRRIYAAMVEVMDRAIGTILRTLEQEGIARDTLIMFLSDNGGPVNAGARNDPLRAGKATVFEGGIRVPALMWWPGRVPEGRVSDQVMTVQDVFPTLASVAGGKPLATKPLDGEDLWSAILTGRSVKRGDLFFAVEPGNQTRQLAVRRGPWKLIRRIEKSTGQRTDLLFHLDEDPRETTDLAAKNPQLVRELGDELERWQALHPRCEIFTTLGPHPGWVPPRDWAKAAVE